MDLKKLLADHLVDENKIIRTYTQDGHFVDMTVDQMISQKKNLWKGWLCAAGISHIYIGYDGDVYRGNCRVGGSLGNIFSNFEIDSKWISCTADFCGCGSDVMTPKILDQNKISLLKNFHEKQTYLDFKRVDKIDDTQVVAVETAFRPPPHIRVQWDLGRRCNYSCSYCWPDVHSFSEPLKSQDSLNLAAETLIKKLPQDKKILFQFGGGEPTLYPEYLNFLRFLKIPGHSVVTTTNGSRHHSFFKDLIKLSSVNISVHFEFANLDKIKKNVEVMLHEIENNETTETLEIKLMTPPGSVFKSKNFLDSLRTIQNFNEKISWSYVPLRHGLVDKSLAAKMVDYTEAELEIIQNRL